MHFSARYHDVRSGVDQLLAANTDGTAKFTPIFTLLARANEEHLGLLGCDTLHMRITSNQDDEASRATFDEAFHRDSAGVPTTCGTFRLTTAQRQVIFYLSSPLLSPRIVTVSISKHSVNMLCDPDYDERTFRADDADGDFQDTAAPVALAPLLRAQATQRMKCASAKGLTSKAVQLRGSIPQLSVLALGTGTGKTLIALAAAMRVMIEEWAHLEANAVDICHARTCGRVSGVSTVDIGDTPTCARLTVCFVPKNVMHHWAQTFHALCSTWPHAHARRAQLWQGIKPASYSMKIAAELPGGPPVVWVVPVGSTGMNVLSDCPSIPIAAIIYDEMTEKMGKRVQLPTSPVLGPTIVAQATIDRLDVSMHGNPNHPMRVAMFDHMVGDVQPTNIEYHVQNRHLRKAHTCMQARSCLEVLLVPTFLSRRIAEQAMTNMPTGILAHTVTFKRSTLGGFVGLSDVQVSTLGGALRHIFSVHADARLPAPLFQLIRAQRMQDELDPEALLHALRAVDAHSYNRHEYNCATRMAGKVEEILGGKAACAICMCTQKELDDEDGAPAPAVTQLAVASSTTPIAAGTSAATTSVGFAKNKLVFASCCTGIFCIRCMQRAKRARPECSLCCQIARHTVLLPAADEVAAARKRKRAATTDLVRTQPHSSHRDTQQHHQRPHHSDGDDPPSNNHGDDDPPANEDADADAFMRRIRNMSRDDMRMPAAQAAAHVVCAAVDELAHGRAARILLFFNMSATAADPDAHGSSYQDCTADYLIRTHLQQVLPEAKVFNLEEMSTKTRESKIALEAYADAELRDTVVLLCTTSNDSKSIAGLDLVNTHATIVCGPMHNSNRLQLIGRVLRMTSVARFQNRPAQVVNLVSE